MDKNTILKICPSFQVRFIGSEKYLYRAKDRLAWEPDIIKNEMFWEVWEFFLKPRSVLEALESINQENDYVINAIKGLIDCGILEVNNIKDGYGYNKFILSKKLINNMESVFFHISTSRMNWVNYSKSKEIQELDHNEMDVKVREEQPPSNFKKYRNSIPKYDLAELIPLKFFKSKINNSIFSKEIEGLNNKISLDLINLLLNYSIAKVGTVEMYATGKHILKPVPSGGARHTTEAYIIVNDGVDGIDFGAYHFNVNNHRLDKINISSFDVNKLIIASNVLVRGKGKKPKVIILHSCIFERSMFRYREARSYRVMHFDLGHIHANEIIVGSILGLDCTESYSVPENLIESILSLNPLKESVMSSFIIY